MLKYAQVLSAMLENFPKIMLCILLTYIWLYPIICRGTIYHASKVKSLTLSLSLSVSFSVCIYIYTYIICI